MVEIEKLKQGEGMFNQFANGKEVFDDYWMYYQTKDMTVEGKPPYKNLREYEKYKEKRPERRH